MNEMVRKVSVRIADVTYNLITSESEASIQRAVAAAERLVTAAREANPSLNQSAGIVLALLNATGDRERLADALLASERKCSAALQETDALRHEIKALKEQNLLLVREIKRTQTAEKKTAPATPAGVQTPPGEREPPAKQALERQAKGNITFVLDPRILQAEEAQDAAATPTQEQSETRNGTAAEEKLPEPQRPSPLIQTGLDDLLPHE